MARNVTHVLVTDYNDQVKWSYFQSLHKSAQMGGKNSFWGTKHSRRAAQKMLSTERTWIQIKGFLISSHSEQM